MEQNLLIEGVMLMLVGMGTVFAFLTVLVAAMTAMAAAVRRYRPSLAPAAAISDEEVAAIAAAIRRHRQS
jgi:oxaloacetate decarboxylase gamma subunit